MPFTASARKPSPTSLDNASLNVQTETVPIWLLSSVIRGAFITGAQYESTEEHDYDELLNAASQYAEYALRGGAK